MRNLNEGGSNNIYDFLGNNIYCNCGKKKCNCSKKEKSCDHKDKKKPCGCPLTLSTECIRWTSESTTYLPILTNESLSSILIKIENKLKDINPSNPTLIENIGTGYQLYAGKSIEDVNQFRTLITTDGVKGLQNTNNISLSVDMDYILTNIPTPVTKNLQQVTDEGNVTNNDLVVTNLDLGDPTEYSTSYKAGSIRTTNHTTTETYEQSFPERSGTFALESYVDEAILSIEEIFLNVKDYGVIGDGITNDSDAIQAVINSAEIGDIKKVYFPEGIYLFDKTVLLPSNIEIFGAGIKNTVFKANSTNTLSVISLAPSLPALWSYKTMISTKGADHTINERVENIKISGITIDWNNVTAGTNSTLPLLIGRCTNCSISNIEILDALDANLDNTTTIRQGHSILFAYDKDSELSNSIINASDYESVAVRYISKGTKIYNNTLIANKPATYRAQNHLLQVAIPTIAKTYLETTFGDFYSSEIKIKDNIFYLQRQSTSAVTIHTSKGVYLSNNIIKVSNAMSHFRALKIFDGVLDFTVLNNVIDASNFNAVDKYLSAISIGQQNATIPNENGLVSGNIVYMGQNAVSTSLPLKKTTIIGGYLDQHKNINISNNSIYVNGYDSFSEYVYYGISGDNNTLSSNNLFLSNPLETITASGNYGIYSNGGQSINIVGNNIFGSIGTGINLLEPTSLPNSNFIIGANNIKNAVTPLINSYANRTKTISYKEDGIQSVNGQVGNVNLAIGNLTDVINYNGSNQFAVTNSTADGVNFRNIVGSDLNVMGSGFRMPRWSDASGSWSNLAVTNSVTNSAIVQWNPTGQLNSNDPTTNLNVVNLQYLNTQLTSKANDSEVLKLNGGIQTVTDGKVFNGIQTFTGTIIVPDPLSNIEAVNKRTLDNTFLTKVKGGVQNVVSDGSTTTYTIPHGSSTIPTVVLVTRGNSLDFTVFSTTWDTTNITIEYQSPPAPGTLVLNWLAYM